MTIFHPNIDAINPSDVLNVDALAKVGPAREKLRAEIFGSAALDASLLPVAGANYMDAVWAAMPNMGTIRPLTVDAGFGLVSNMWNFRPQVPNGSAVIVHAGHSQQSIKAPYQAVIKKLIGIGCEVTAIDMPLAGLNDTNPVINTPFGRFPVGRYHVNLQPIHTDEFNPLSFFMTPILSAVNDFVDRGITNIAMFGLSGGGWSTDLYAALDERVKLSYSLAGSLPVYMRGWVSGSWGDWEQHEIGSLGFDYLDLYVLGAVGTDRHKANLYIVNDSCCFGGYNAEHFEPIVSESVSTIGSGEYSVDFDTTVSSHTISTWTINWVSNDILARF